MPAKLYSTESSTVKTFSFPRSIWAREAYEGRGLAGARGTRHENDAMGLGDCVSK